MLALNIYPNFSSAFDGLEVGLSLYLWKCVCVWVSLICNCFFWCSKQCNFFFFLYLDLIRGVNMLNVCVSIWMCVCVSVGGVCGRKYSSLPIEWCGQIFVNETKYEFGGGRAKFYSQTQSERVRLCFKSLFQE